MSEKGVSLRMCETGVREQYIHGGYVSRRSFCCFREHVVTVQQDGAKQQDGK